MRSAELDAVTVDAFGTLVGLRDPAPALARLTGRSEQDVQGAFRAEVAFYREHSNEGRDASSLAELRGRCAQVFSRALGTELEADLFVSALEYEALEGVPDALDRLRAHGLAVAVVANWDCALPEHLGRLGLARCFDVVVTSAEATASKPDPRIFRLALDRLAVAPGRALHIGDDDADERGAAAAGMAFARAPLPAVVAALENGTETSCIRRWHSNR